MLSEIAQEHGVEWDISSAADMLPSGTSAVAAPARLPGAGSAAPPLPGVLPGL